MALGGLGYARYKVASVCSGGEDIEFHDLAREIHMTHPSVHGRPVWVRQSCMLYLHASAVCDWWESRTREERRDFYVRRPGSQKTILAVQNGWVVLTRAGRVVLANQHP